MACNRQTEGVQTILRHAGEASVGLCKNNKHTKNYDNELSILSKRQEHLTIKMHNSKDTDKKSTLKTERNKTEYTSISKSEKGWKEVKK